MRLLLSLIPVYYRHVQANPGTLLTRFYGVHRLTPIIGRQVRQRRGMYASSRVIAAGLLQPAGAAVGWQRRGGGKLKLRPCKSSALLATGRV